MTRLVLFIDDGREEEIVFPVTPALIAEAGLGKVQITPGSLLALFADHVKETSETYHEQRG